MTAPTIHAATLSPQTIEPDTDCWMYCKAYDNNTAKWIRTGGTWVQTAGTTVALTVVDTADGRLVHWHAPKVATTQTYTFRLTQTATSGETGSGSVTHTVPPWQTGGI